MESALTEAGRDYDRWLSGWSPISLYVRWSFRHRRPPEAAQILDSLGRGPFPRILDVGCALGVYLLEAWDRGHGRSLLAGVEVGPRMVREAAERLERSVGTSSRIEIKLASAARLPFEDSSFDAVICNGVIKYLDEDEFDEFLGEARRVLTPGGRFVVSELAPLPQSSPRAVPGVPVNHLRRPGEIECAMLDHGFVDTARFELPRLRRLPFAFEGVSGMRS